MLPGSGLTPAPEKEVRRMNALRKQLFAKWGGAFYIVLGVSMLGLVSSLVYWLFLGNVDATVLKSDALFSDYFDHIAFASTGDRIYHISYDACFPPLAYCFYFLLWKINPFYGDYQNWNSFKYETNNLLIYVIYNMILAVFLLYAIQMILKKYSSGQTLALSLLILLSYPFFATSIQRGNATALVGILLCIAFAWKDSPNRIYRELALILIAVAAGFKIYPAFVGLVYLIEKRYKEALRLLVYGVILFFGPFVFWGGMQGFKDFVWLMIGREQEIVKRWGTIRGITNIYLSGLMGDMRSNAIGWGLENIYLIVSVVLAYMTKTNWKRIFYITAVLVLYVPVNWMYTLVYLLPALLFFIRDKDRLGSWLDFGFAVLWGIIFSLPSWMLLFHIEIYEGVYKILYILWILCAFSDIRICWKGKISGRILKNDRQ